MAVTRLCCKADELEKKTFVPLYSFLIAVYVQAESLQGYWDIYLGLKQSSQWEERRMGSCTAPRPSYGWQSLPQALVGSGTHTNILASLRRQTQILEFLLGIEG